MLCPLCKSETEYRYTITRFTPNFDILVCKACGLEMQSKMPADDSAFYTEDYYSGRADYAYHDERRQEEFERIVYQARLRKVADYVPAPADFLDVGCAYGGLALEAARAGYRAHGLDISQQAVKIAHSRGVDANQGRLTDNIFGAGSMDAVTMIEVIEHLANPAESVQALAEIIRPGGVLVIQTANYSGLQAKTQGADYHYYLPGHLHYFSRSNLTALLKRSGFSKVDFFGGVEFGLIPKLRKSRGSFQSIGDYARWLRISWYHLKSKAAFGNFALTSAMVLYAVKD